MESCRLLIWCHSNWNYCGQSKWIGRIEWLRSLVKCSSVHATWPKSLQVWIFGSKRLLEGQTLDCPHRRMAACSIPKNRVYAQFWWPECISSSKDFFQILKFHFQNSEHRTDRKHLRQCSSSDVLTLNRSQTISTELNWTELKQISNDLETASHWQDDLGCQTDTHPMHRSVLTLNGGT